MVVKVDPSSGTKTTKTPRRPRGETELRVAEGNGPVNALANALRLALTESYPQLNAFTSRLQGGSAQHQERPPR